MNGEWRTEGFEPSTSRLRASRSDQLSYVSTVICLVDLGRLELPTCVLHMPPLFPLSYRSTAKNQDRVYENKKVESRDDFGSGSHN